MACFTGAMMQIIGLNPVPNQQLTVVLDGVLYNLTLRLTNGCMSVDILRAGEVIVSGQRIVAGQPFLPYVVLEGQYGNFVMLTQDGDLPDYTQFGLTQVLVWATAAEIGAARLAA